MNRNIKHVILFFNFLHYQLPQGGSCPPVAQVTKVKHGIGRLNLCTEFKLVDIGIMKREISSSESDKRN